MAKINNVGELKAFIANLPDDMIVGDYDHDWSRTFEGKIVDVTEMYLTEHNSLKAYSSVDWSENEDGIPVKILSL